MSLGLFEESRKSSSSQPAKSHRLFLMATCRTQRAPIGETA